MAGAGQRALSHGFDYGTGTADLARTSSKNTVTSSFGFLSARAPTTCRRSSAPISFLKRLLQVGPESSSGQNKLTFEHPHLQQQAMTSPAASHRCWESLLCQTSRCMPSASRCRFTPKNTAPNRLGTGLLLPAAEIFLTRAMIITACFPTFTFVLTWSHGSAGDTANDLPGPTAAAAFLYVLIMPIASEHS